MWFLPIQKIHTSLFVNCVQTIETFFSDEKSRGFHLEKSHLADPERLSTLMIAACPAYLWIIHRWPVLADREKHSKMATNPRRPEHALFGGFLLNHCAKRDLQSVTIQAYLFIYKSEIGIGRNMSIASQTNHMI